MLTLGIGVSQTQDFQALCSRLLAACLHLSFISMDLTPAVFSLIWDNLTILTLFVYNVLLRHSKLYLNSPLPCAGGEIYEGKDPIIFYLHPKQAYREWVYSGSVLWIRAFTWSFWGHCLTQYMVILA